jgi:hypothetical protein
MWANIDPLKNNLIGASKDFYLEVNAKKSK